MDTADRSVIESMFAIIRSAVCGDKLSEREKQSVIDAILQILYLSGKHDLSHLIALGLKNNEIIYDDKSLEQVWLKAVYRYEQQRYEFERICNCFEKMGIAFMPLKGSVLRKYYPEPWMRTSCDIDILVHSDDVEKAISCLNTELGYKEKERATHDVSLFSLGGIHVELHFDLVEEGRANLANIVLQTVWEHSTVKFGSHCHYEMSDEMFYFYHVAHMAKHFEVGGCGIRPFLDLYILDNLPNVDVEKRDNLLKNGGLLQFAFVSRALARTWFGKEEPDELVNQMQDFIIHGGAYGTSSNRVALQQARKGGKVGYIVSRIFIPYAKLKRYYPILEQHKWLMPIMQIRRWFMLLRPSVARMAKNELSINQSVDSRKAAEMNDFLGKVGL